MGRHVSSAGDSLGERRRHGFLRSRKTPLATFTLALLVSLLAVPTAASARAAPVTGTWSGTIGYVAQGQWEYTIGYSSGDTTRRTMGTSTHDLQWQVDLTGVKGSATFDQFTDVGQAVVEEFAWSGSAQNVPTGSNCSYTAAGGMNAPASAPFNFEGLSAEDAPKFGGQGTMLLTTSQADCGHGVIFGFSGPNAGTLWSGGGYDTYLWNATPDSSQASPRFSLCTEPLQLDSAPTPSTDDQGQTVLQGTTTGSCDGTRVEWFGDSDVHHISTVTGTYTYDLTFTPDPEECPVQSSYDAFRPYAKDSQEAWLQFDLTTEWCMTPAGEVRVLGVTPGANVIEESNFVEFFIADFFEFAFSYSDEWVGPAHSVSGSQVTARATIRTCLGIPILGKIKYVRALPKGFDGLARILERVDGKWKWAATKAAWLATKAAKALRWAIKQGTRPAKWAARQAVRAFETFVYSLGERIQRKLLLLTVGVVADWSSSSPEARWFLRTLAQKGLVKIATKSNDLLGKFLESKVCWNIWRPKIRQTLGSSPTGTFIDRSGDMPWRVERHTGAF